MDRRHCHNVVGILEYRYFMSGVKTPGWFGHHLKPGYVGHGEHRLEVHTHDTKGFCFACDRMVGPVDQEPQQESRELQAYKLGQSTARSEAYAKGYQEGKDSGQGHQEALRCYDLGYYAGLVEGKRRVLEAQAESGLAPGAGELVNAWLARLAGLRAGWAASLRPLSKPKSLAPKALGLAHRAAKAWAYGPGWGLVGFIVTVLLGLLLLLLCSCSRPGVGDHELNNSGLISILLLLFLAGLATLRLTREQHCLECRGTGMDGWGFPCRACKGTGLS